jgi:transposase-like protein
MAAPRLSDAQKLEIVSRFQGGAGTQELASAYGCSPNTVIRVVRAAIEPALYEELKRQRGRRAGQAPGLQAAIGEAEPVEAEAVEAELALPEPAEVAVVEHSASAVDLLEQPAVSSDGSIEAAPVPPPIATAAPVASINPAQQDEPGSPGAGERDHDAARALAIDDADDFDAFDDEDDEDDQDDEDESAGGDDQPEQLFVEVPVSLSATLDQPLTTARPWCSEELPASAYMLVDKTVELQSLPLAEIPELGRLEAAEQELQALVLYSNPRQAKRHCGRTQRVIKIPDVGLLERRATYLLRQGIRRVVVEGALYALPEG